MAVMGHHLLFSISLLLLVSRLYLPQEPSKSPASITEAENVLAQSMRLHHFSDPAKQDTFKVKLVGAELQTAIVRFQIINSKGQSIYTEKFDARYLLNYEVSEDATSAEKDAFILDRVRNFFADENFKVPAVKPEIAFNPDYSDRRNWKDIKANKAAVGFYYLLGEEDGRWIAYSKAQQRVVLYYNCC